MGCDKDMAGMRLGLSVGDPHRVGISKHSCLRRQPHLQPSLFNHQPKPSCLVALNPRTFYPNHWRHSTGIN